LSNEEVPEDLEKLKRELAFYRNQTKVLREKNRDLRNALLLAESKEAPIEKEREIAGESLSDIRKIISDSKKQIADKLSQFKETLKETSTGQSKTAGSTTTPASPVSPSMKDQATSPETEVLARQCEYLKQEIERLENFLEQSEMVNNRLRELLTQHNIDVSEISKAISEVSKSAISQKARQRPSPATSTTSAPTQKPAVSATKPAAASTPTVTTKPTPEPIKELDPEIAKIFNAFRAKLGQNLSEDDIKIEILNLREQLMELIPHSRVFYEMQMEYRRWKRGTSSIANLKAALKEWEKTIASM